jgi:hypothetical protein
LLQIIHRQELKRPSNNASTFNNEGLSVARAVRVLADITSLQAALFCRTVSPWKRIALKSSGAVLRFTAGGYKNGWLARWRASICLSLAPPNWNWLNSNSKSGSPNAIVDSRRTQDEARLRGLLRDGGPAVRPRSVPKQMLVARGV